MSGNCWGRAFQVTTFGESHGPALGVIVDGCPPGVALSEDLVQRDLDRRRPGQGPASTTRSEEDEVEILSGLFEGRTTGTPIGMIIRNKDHQSSAYDALKDLFRPGHADLTYFLKYGVRDHRGGGRASGRETAARVAAGAAARAVLRGVGVSVKSGVIRVGDVEAIERDFEEAERNPLRCPDAEAAERMLELVMECARSGDTVGGVVEIVATGVPAGLGEPVFGKLDADLAGALMGIGAVKGVEIGDGFAAASRKGSENSDPLEKGGGGHVASRRNFAGGVLGGISTGEPIIARIAVKPTPSIASEQDTVTKMGAATKVQVKGRHDPCICPRIAPVAEAMALITLCDHLLRQRGQTGKAGPLGELG